MASRTSEPTARRPNTPGLAAFVLLAGLSFSASCTPPDTGFSEANAQAHIRMLAGTIGSRPIGSDANRRAREYITAQLRGFGFDVEVQETEAVRPEHGVTVRVANIIATRAGRFDQAIALVSHYDSVPDGPGASDDALAVAVCLEAGRVLARNEQANHALALIFTDGEEVGLMGAVALMKHPIRQSLGAVLNFESIGSAGPDLLFQADIPGDLLVGAWARSAPRPGGSSYAVEIYNRMPNDTDFTVFKRAGIPGLNFAAVGDGYSYHTGRDTPARVDPRVLRDRGANTVAVVRAIDRMGDLSAGRRQPVTYFDVLHVRAFAYRWQAEIVLFAAAMLAALFAWLTLLPVARRAAGPAQLWLTVAWTVVGAAAVFGAMCAAAWLLRTTRETYHPWYAYPDRFFVFLALAGVLAGRAVVLAGRLLPRGARGSAHPAVAWLVVLPFWAVLAVTAQLAVPLASYLAVLPLLATGAALVVSPVHRNAGLRAASVVALAAAGLLWLPQAVLMLRFAVPTLGLLPVVTPLYVYPALLVSAGVFVVPPLVALACGGPNEGAATVARWRVSGNALIAAASAAAAAWCWFAPAYTHERPLRASISYVNDRGTGAYWHIASNEPGAVAGISGPVVGGWRLGGLPRTVGAPLLLSQAPFQFNAVPADSAGAPATATGSFRRDGDGAVIEVHVVPERAGLAVAVNLPPNVVPEETNFAVSRRASVGQRGGRQSAFTARYAPLPPEGLTFRVRVSAAGVNRLDSVLETTVTIISPGVPGARWPELPRWLPQDHVAWVARSYFILSVRFSGVRLGT